MAAMRQQLASSTRPINFWDRPVLRKSDWINELNAPSDRTHAPTSLSESLLHSAKLPPRLWFYKHYSMELINLLASGMNRATQINKNGRIIFYQLPFKRALSRLIIFREFTMLYRKWVMGLFMQLPERRYIII